MGEFFPDTDDKFKGIDSKILLKKIISFVNNVGYDIHSFEDKKEMFLGGVKLPYDYGFKAHSDGDVLIHSLIDAKILPRQDL